jgi:hypothetical protein
VSYIKLGGKAVDIAEVFTIVEMRMKEVVEAKGGKSPQAKTRACGAVCYPVPTQLAKEFISQYCV